MEIQGFFILTLIMTCDFSDLGINSRYFAKYSSKRLEFVTKVMTSSGLVECAASCLATDGCYAVNFKLQYKSNCELTSDYNRCTEEPEFCMNGATCEAMWTSATCHCMKNLFGNLCNIEFVVDLRKDCNPYNDIHYMRKDDANDQEACKIWCANNAICGGFVVGHTACWFKDYNKCTEEPEFCLNNATCEQTWTSARCHCTENLFGHSCNIGFVIHSQKDCDKNHNIHYMGDDADNDHEACKIWCANNAICGGFVVAVGGCYFKDTTYGNNFANKDEADTYVKDIN